MLVVSLDGAIQFCSSDVRGWLKQFFSRPPRARLLPRTVSCWVKLGDRASGDRALIAKHNGVCLFIRRCRPNPVDCITLLLELVPAQACPGSRRHGGLTAREHEVHHWIAAGKSNDDMAAILGCSASTVRKHLEHIFQKLGVENRTAAASFYRNADARLANDG